MDMLDVIKANKDDIGYVIHLGDHCYDSKCINYVLQVTPLVAVCGNCDYFCGDDYTEEKVFELYGKKFLICHGHQYGVKSSYDTLYYAAKKNTADIVLFGHTHTAVVETKDNITIMNPGSIGNPKGLSKPSYGVIEIDNDNVEFKIIEV